MKENKSTVRVFERDSILRIKVKCCWKKKMIFEKFTFELPIIVTEMVSAASGRSSTHPVAFESARFPAFLAIGLLFQRVGIQINDFEPRKVCLEVAVRHPELAIMLETQTNFFFLVVRNELPLR